MFGFRNWVMALAVAAGAAGAADLPPRPLRDPGRTPEVRVREYAFKDYSSIGITHTVPCRIRYVDPYFGYLDDKTYYLDGKMPFQSECFESNVGDLFPTAPVRYDQSAKQWVRDLTLWLEFRAPVTPKRAREWERAIRVYPLNNENSQGFAYTDDMLIGDEATRTRQLHYCLFRAAVALCGRGDVGLQREGPKGDLTPYTLRILRSIVFLDDTGTPLPPVEEPSAVAAAAAASAASAATR